jgi:hypothetical protein
MIDHPEEARWRAYLLRRPDSAGGHNNLGQSLQAQGRNREALECFDQALRLDPRLAEAHYNRGVALLTLARSREAVASLQEALRLKPEFLLAYNNLGCALSHEGRAQEAEAAYARCLELDPNFAGAHHNRSLLWLEAGDFVRGWPEYEWRFGRAEQPPPSYPQPRWHGEPLAGRTLLVYAEQGLGDTLLFLRYLPLIERDGGTVVLECQGALRQLLSRWHGADRLVFRGEPLPLFHVHVPLLSLPGLLGTTEPRHIPVSTPYLEADPDLCRQWQARLAAWPGFRIGIAWQGNPSYVDDCRRSAPLASFAPLARVPGVRLLSLQKGPGLEQLDQVPFEVHDLGSTLDESAGPFMDTAAVMKHLDLVVTVDTATVHLAGGLGVPAWLALASAAHWQWLREPERAVWYPTVRLFRQQRAGDWEGVFERMATCLANMGRKPA